jgi:DNA-binding MarR family transcriptional regulator
MDRASSLIYPGSRTLAGWWRQLHAYQPQAFWIGYSFLHRVEAHVNVVRAQPVEPLTHLVLQALALEQTQSVSLADLQARLRLPIAVVQRVLVGMEREGLLSRSPPDRWQVTERGNEALRCRHVPMHVQERRVFPFLECLDASGLRLGPPRFLPVAECAGAPWLVDAAHQFDVTWLPASIGQSIEWKKACGFPAEVESLADSTASEAWQHVIVDRPERVLFVLILSKTAGSSELLGFAVKVDGWTLYDQMPVLRVPESARTALPELVSPAAEVWQEAWRSWCRQRQLPMNEVEICVLAYHSPRLEVQPPPRLLQRLHAAKSDLFKGDAWLLVGEGYVRTAAQLAVRQ